MILPLADILLTLPILLLALIFVYLSGFVIARISGHRYPVNAAKNPVQVFPFLFTGFAAIISIFAIIHTSGKTVLLPVPLFVFLFWRDPANRQIADRPISHHGVWITACVLLWWVFYASHFMSLNGNQVAYVGSDDAFYARLADFMMTRHTETTITDLSGLVPLSREPYHYADLWPVSMLRKFTGLHPTLLLHAVVYPILSVTATLGIASFLREALGGKNLFFLALTAGFINGFIFINEWLQPGTNLSYSIAAKPKLFVVLMVVTGMLHSLRNARWMQAAAMVAMGMALYTPVAIPLLLSLLLVMLIAILRRQPAWTEIIPSFLILLLSTLYLYFFYRDTANGISPGSSMAFNFRTGMNIMLGGLLQWVAFLPFLIPVLLVKNIRSILRNALPVSAWILLLLLPLFGLMTWAAFHTLSYDAVQLYQNIFVPVAVIMAVFLLAVVFHSGQRVATIIASIVLLISLGMNLQLSFNKFHIEKKEFQEASAFLQRNGNGFFGNLRDWTGKPVFERNTQVFQPHTYFDYLQSPYENISLDAALMQVPKEWYYAEQVKQTAEQSPFGIYRNRYPDIPVPQLMLLFIKEKNIRYLSTGPGASIPELLRSKFNDSITLRENQWKLYHIAD